MPIDPTVGKSQRLPKPASNVHGDNTREPAGESFSDVAKRYKPKNVGLETPSCTVSRYALALINQTTGEAVSAEDVGSGSSQAALTYAGSDPNIPENLTISGYTVPGDAPVTLARGIDILPGNPTWGVYGAGWSADHQYNNWDIYFGEVLKFTNSADTLTPVGLTGWTLPGGGTQPVFTGDAPVATHHGQWCKASTAWWQWNGSVWIPRQLLNGKQITRNDANTAYFSLGVDAIGLPTTTPFP